MLRVKQLIPLLRSLRLLPPSLVIALASLDAVAQNMAIKGATILDVTNGEMIKNHVVIVKDGRIDSVAPARSVEIPKGIEVLDLQGVMGPFDYSVSEFGIKDTSNTDILWIKLIDISVQNCVRSRIYQAIRFNPNQINLIQMHLDTLILR